MTERPPQQAEPTATGQLFIAMFYSYHIEFADHLTEIPPIREANPYAARQARAEFAPSIPHSKAQTIRPKREGLMN